jgi:hypothetical protein
MHKLCLYFSLGFLAAMIGPLAKAQTTGPCVVLEDSTAHCQCNGFPQTVLVKQCGILRDLNHCYQFGYVVCCSNPLIQFPTYVLGDPCTGPKLPTALKGLPEGQQVYMRNCRGLYVASRVQGSDGRLA